MISLLKQGWIECAGIADRCDYDLKQHGESGQDFSIEKNFSMDNVTQKLKEMIQSDDKILKNFDQKNIFMYLDQEDTVDKIQTFIRDDNAK